VGPVCSLDAGRIFPAQRARSSRQVSCGQHLSEAWIRCVGGAQNAEGGRRRPAQRHAVTTDWQPRGDGTADRRQFECYARAPEDGAAWALKETAMALYHYIYERPARKHFRWWWNWAQRSRLEPISAWPHAQRRFENVITYLRHRITTRAANRSRKDPMGEVHGTRISQSQNFINAHLNSTAAGSI